MAQHILIVDDSKFIRKMIESPLLKAGYRTTSTGEPREALISIADNPPDLIISDLKMPTMMDGIGFLSMVAMEANHIPVMVYTADPGAEAAISGVGLKTVIVLKKPAAPAVLLQKIAFLFA